MVGHTLEPGDARLSLQEVLSELLTLVGEYVDVTVGAADAEPWLATVMKGELLYGTDLAANPDEPDQSRLFVLRERDTTGFHVDSSTFRGGQRTWRQVLAGRRTRERGTGATRRKLRSPALKRAWLLARGGRYSSAPTSARSCAARSAIISISTWSRSSWSSSWESSSAALTWVASWAFATIV